MSEKAAVWRAHQAAWRDSGVSVAAYCRRRRLSYAGWMYWLRQLGGRLQPLIDALTSRLLAAPMLHADETPVAQLDPGSGRTYRAYLFAYQSTGDRPTVVFDYCASRSGQHARHFLGDWRGALMVDDYAGYNGNQRILRHSQERFKTNLRLGNSLFCDD